MKNKYTLKEVAEHMDVLLSELSKPVRDHSYTCKVEKEFGVWFANIYGINGKFVFTSAVLRKRSYAVRQAKSFCEKTTGIKLVLDNNEAKEANNG